MASLLERAEAVAEQWERGRYGDKTLRLRAEETAEVLRELLKLLAAYRLIHGHEDNPS